MFIVWRRRPIRSDRTVELFVAYDPVPLDNRDERGGKSRREKRCPSLDDPAWKPLYCRHTGPGRIAWTPLLIHSGRIAGKPRQRLLCRFATIRSCCIADEFMRAAWWYSVFCEISYQEQDLRGLLGRKIVRDEKAIVSKLREVVPSASRRGTQEFTAYRLRKEKEQQKEMAAFLAALRRAEAQRQREEEARKEQERQRQREEEGRREQEQDEDAGREEERDEEAGREQERQRREEQSRASRPRSAPPWWEVLGLPATATWEEVQTRYRKLAKEHHPDRDGKAPAFIQVQLAFAEAKNYFRANQ